MNAEQQRLDESRSRVLSKAKTPRDAWARNSAYDDDAKKLAGRFKDNFKTYEAGTSADIKAAGPA